MHPAELEIKDTKESINSVSCVDLVLLIGRYGQYYTPIYEKRDYFNFYITNVPVLEL